MEPNWDKLECEYYKNFDPYGEDLTDEDFDVNLGDYLLDQYEDEAISLD